MKNIATPDDMNEFAGSWVSYETTNAYFGYRRGSSRKGFSFISNKKKQFQVGYGERPDGYEMCHLLPELQVPSTCAVIQSKLTNEFEMPDYLHVRSATADELDYIIKSLSGDMKLNYDGDNLSGDARQALRMA